MRSLLLFSFICLMYAQATSQSVSINTDGTTAHPSSMLEVKSTNRGALLPRLTTAQRDAIAAPAAGLIVYNTTTNEFNYFDGTVWQAWNSNWLRNGNNLYNRNFNTGFVGIGTTTPLSRLHVADSNVLFIGSPGVPDYFSTVQLPVQGSGKRMMWFAEKAAFRAGYAIGTEWNADSIGSASFAVGNGSKAKGYASAAFNNGQATGDGAFAGGFGTASGLYSIAFGSGAVASGQYAFANGEATAASGLHSVVFGSTAVASGELSFAMGNGTLRSQGLSSFAFGTNNIVNANYSFGFGRNIGLGTSSTHSAAFGQQVNISGTHSFAFGNNVTSTGNYNFTGGQNAQTTGNNAFAFGLNASGLGTASLAIGENAAAADSAIALGKGAFSGARSIAIGNGAISNGANNLAIGWAVNNNASSSFSTAIGWGARTNGGPAFAAGYQVQALSINSTVIGSESVAAAMNAVAIGYGNSAVATGATVLGSNNIGNTQGGTVVGRFNDFSGSDRIFEIGNGSGNSARANAVTVLTNGNFGIGTVSPVAKLDVIGSFRVDPLNAESGYVLTADNSGFATWQPLPAAPNYWTENSGNIYNNTGGNVGIGLNNPQVALSFAQVLGKKVSLFRGASGDAGFGVWGNELRIHSDYNGADITFGYDNLISGFTENVRMRANGNVGIGTPAPISPLSFASTLGSKIALWGNNTNNHYGFGIQGFLFQMYCGNAADNIAFGHGSSTNFTELMRIQGNGNVGIGTTAPTQRLHVIGNILASGTITPSDLRYKTQVQTIASPLSRLIQLSGVTYFLNQQAFPEWQFDSTLQYGVIAQEVERLFPEMVTTINEKGYKGVNYTQLIPVLIESVKELNQKVEQAEKEKRSLQEQLLLLAKRVEALEQKK